MRFEHLRIHKITTLFVFTFVLLSSYQNCGEIDLIKFKDETKTADPTPDPIPGTDPTPSPTPPGGGPQDDDENDHYNTDDAVDRGSCGSFSLRKDFDLYEEVDGEPEPLPFIYIHQVIDDGDGLPYRYLAPGSTTPENIEWIGAGSRWPDESKISFQYYLPSCDLNVVEARFKDKCGEPVELGAIYTFAGCRAIVDDPTPNEGDVVRMTNENDIELERAKLAFTQMSGNGAGYGSRNVETLPRATYDPNYTPSPPLEQWPMRTGDVYTFINKDTYLSMEFKAPAGTDKHRIGFSLSSGGNCGIPSIAVSEYEGDFYLGRGSNNCSAMNPGAEGIQLSAETNTSSPSFCELEPGKHYYLNMTFNNFRTGKFPTDFTVCRLFWNLHFYKNNQQL